MSVLACADVPETFALPEQAETLALRVLRGVLQVLWLQPLLAGNAVEVPSGADK